MVYVDNKASNDFSSEEERTEDGTDDSSIDSEIPQINGVSIGDLNIDNDLRRNH